MGFLQFIRLTVLIGVVVSGQQWSDIQTKQLSRNNVKAQKNPRQGQVMCARLSKEPYFGVEMLVNRPWRIYYTWNMDLQNKCLDMVFRNATPAIISRIYNDMNDYLETEPYWDAATLLVSMGRARHEMLLFADQGAAGRFQGVPNIIRDGSITPSRKTVPLLKFHLKLMYGGTYLVMADCHIGVSTLSARKNKMPYRAEIGSLASKLDLGPGLQACMSDKNQDEQLSPE